MADVPRKPQRLFSLKMRASAHLDGKDCHISGVEKILSKEQLPDVARALVSRGMNHAKGDADFLNLKIEELLPEAILYLDAPPVTTIEVDSWQEGLREVERFLREEGIDNIDGIMQRLQESYAMRGAMLLDIHTLERLEPDQARGVRATYMDCERTDNTPLSDVKNHFAEAIVLAAKVMNCPGVVGEICISDDPDYVTGYVASKRAGYRRITRMKPLGSEQGGRIFLFDSTLASPADAIHFLEKQPVIVRTVARPFGPGEIGCAQRAHKLTRFREKLATLRENNLFRTMRAIESAQAAHIVSGGREMVLMSSNSYLDLTAHPLMKQCCMEALEKYGFGAGGSRLTTGNTDLHEKLERKIASFKGTEAAVLFNTGYTANTAIIAALADKESVVFSDELNHASIIDGCRLSRAKIVIYRHNDMADLEAKIRENPCVNGLVVSDAVFSMDGDILPFPRFLDICEKYDLLSMIDEAHSTGVLGEQGHGIQEHFHESRYPDILMGTLSKAVGAEGGYAACSQLLADYLRNTARGFIFSTAMSPVTAEAALTGLELIEQEPGRVQRLQRNIACFCEVLREGGLNVSSETPIIPIVIGDEGRALAVAQQLYEAGILIPAIRYPTVAKGSARLRVSLMATHTEAELRRVASLICQAIIKKT